MVKPVKNSKRKRFKPYFNKNVELEKIQFLIQKMIPPTIEEQNELMFLLKKNQLIDDCQYRHYINFNTETVPKKSTLVETVETALLCVFVILMTYFLCKHILYNNY